jgi:hypothetical protein
MDDSAMALILTAVLLFAVIFGPLFGQDSRPAWKDVSRRPDFRATGSMDPADWREYE